MHPKVNIVITDFFSESYFGCVMELKAQFVVYQKSGMWGKEIRIKSTPMNREVLYILLGNYFHPYFLLSGSKISRFLRFYHLANSSGLWLFLLCFPITQV
jgi:hypothetical protein